MEILVRGGTDTSSMQKFGSGTHSICLSILRPHNLLRWEAPLRIIVFDNTNGELGIAAASRVPFVGHDVPWAEGGTGVIATQAYVNQAYGPDGLALLRAGLSAQETIDSLTGADEDREIRQLGIVDASGEEAGFTG